MESKNIFDEIGKKVPYGVPDNFFETITERTLVKARKARRKKIWIRTLIPLTAAASVLIIITFNFLSKTQQPVHNEILSKNQMDLKQNDIQLDSLKESNKIIIRDTSTKQPKEPNNSVPLESEESLESLLAKLSNEELDELSGIISLEIYSDESNMPH